MDIKTKEALIAEINCFEEEALKMHIVQVLADSYTNTSLFDYNIDSDGSVIWYKAQARQLWDFWKAAKAQAVPEGFVLVEKDLIQSIHQSCNNALDINDRDIYKGLCMAIIDDAEAMIEAQEQSND